MTRELTPAELDALAAWWEANGSNVRAAFLLGRAEQTVKNTLYQLRRRHEAESNVELVHRYFRQIEKHRKSMKRRAA